MNEINALRDHACDELGPVHTPSHPRVKGWFGEIFSLPPHFYDQKTGDS